MRSVGDVVSLRSGTEARDVSDQIKSGRIWEDTRMKMHACLVVGAMILTATAPAILAQTRSLSTPASMEGVIQDADLAGKPTYNFEEFIRRYVVKLALGTALGTPRSNEVLAIAIACDSSSASLTLFD